ncbi:MAG TPA: hypothetical protein VE573_05960 [Nitrososphaeraceae archaeon]|nr:hypothetical protein [Nitrososphaeraceae archaeon]
MKQSNKFIFSSSSLQILTLLALMLLFFTCGHSVTGQRPQTVSTINFTSPTTSNVSSPNNISTTDAIGISMNNIMSDNMDKFLNQTILPLIGQPNSVIKSNTSDKQTPEESKREIVQPILTSDSDMIVGNDDQSQKTTTEESTDIDNTRDVNSPISFADNQTVLLQFQDPGDTVVIDRLQRIENIADKQVVNENATKTVAKSVQESNKMLIQDLMGIRSSLNGSSPSTFQSVTSSGVTGLDNLTDRITSIQKSNNKILQDVVGLSSPVQEQSRSYILPPIISSIVAAIVSFSAIILFLCMRTTGPGIRFDELRFQNKYR